MSVLITQAQLVAILPNAKRRAAAFVPYLNKYMQERSITTPKRIAAFIAQIGHESGELVHTRELWGPTPTQLGYEGRVDLGNVKPGDGIKFKGRGLIQVTGRHNYKSCSLALFNDLRLLDQPGLLELPEHATASAAWFWQAHGLNELADKDDFHRITKIINGGYNGIADRIAHYNSARKELLA